MSRQGLLAAAREWMRRQAVARRADEVVVPAPAPRRRPPEPVRDTELEQLEAEARYHRERHDLYQARVISGSSAPTSASRLRELKHTATAAADRLAHARRARRHGPG